MKTLRDTHEVIIPPLQEVIRLNEVLANAAGALSTAKTIGIALNTTQLSEADAKEMILLLEKEIGLPVTDVVRFGAEKLGKCLL
jgi:uncharacterized NAD-dependent epimerase/dehydratase family protein